MLLMLLAASWLCCDAIDEKSRLYHDLLRNYTTDVEPPLSDGVTNTTVEISLELLCATPVDDFVSIEGWIVMVGSVVIGLTTVNAVLMILQLPGSVFLDALPNLACSFTGCLF